MNADQFNKRFPLGTPVYYWPGIRDLHNPELRRLEGETRTPAWNLGHGEPVVSVTGYAGGIALTHVEARSSLETDHG